MGWTDLPIGAADAERWVTRTGCATVLLLADTLTSGQRLLPVAEELGRDPRVQLVAAVPPGRFSRGAHGWLETAGFVVLPWDQVLRTSVDLVLASGSTGIAQVHGPVVLIPHGVGFIKVPDRGNGAPAGADAFGLGGQWLVEDGRVVPAAIVLAHGEERDRLALACPAAAPAAVVAGDPCADALLAGRRPPRPARPGRGARRPRLVLSSTWGPQSLMAARIDRLPGIAREAAAAGWQVCLLSHPNVWAAHGRWQVQRWLKPFRQAGGEVLAPEDDWCAALAAADAVVGDHGSVLLYATLTRAPVLRWNGTGARVAPSSPMAELLRIAPPVPDRGPAFPAVAAAVRSGRDPRLDTVAARITDHPGRFFERLLPVLYRTLGIQPPDPGAVPPGTELPQSGSFAHQEGGDAR
ncbi:hypothetical protein [Nocardiopsis coralliicola]